MSILASLTLSEVTKKSETSTPHLNLRRKMVAAIDEQIAGATAEATGQHFSRTVEKVVKNADTGTTEKRAVERSLRRWWWRAADGVHLELRFGNRAIKIGTGNSIIVGQPTNLVPTLETVRQAVMAGELDDALKAASDGRKRVKKVEKVAATAKQPSPKLVK